MSAAHSDDADARWQRWRRVLSDEPLPAMVLDLDALDRNLAALLTLTSRHAHDAALTLRLATKSLRCPAVVRYVLDAAAPRVRGLMTSTAAETALYAAQGFDDLLLGYPVARPAEANTLARLAADGVNVVAMIDCAEHVALLDDAARAADTRMEVCLDVDASLRLLDQRVHLGVRRSPIRSAADARALAHAVARSSHLELGAVMAYEAQIAGLADRVPGKRAMGLAQRAIKAVSRPRVASLRAEVEAALRADGHPIRLVNGGGTGSLASTAADPSVTEVTVGSGLYAPTLFDHYDGLALEPALFFALAVARRPDADIVTCAGGGYIASGPPAADRAPTPWLPTGLSPLPHEGFGEVQTPFQVSSRSRVRLAIGDPVLCRPAKAGEPLSRFATLLMVRGETLVERAATVRGLEPTIVT